MSRIYLLTWRQYLKRGAMLTSGLAGTLGYFELQRHYLEQRNLAFAYEYEVFKQNPNYYHSLHE